MPKMDKQGIGMAGRTGVKPAVTDDERRTQAVRGSKALLSLLRKFHRLSDVKNVVVRSPWRSEQQFELGPRHYNNRR
jgi:hypothetical protein